MASSALQASIKQIKDIQKGYIHKHKELFSILKEIEIKSVCTSFPHDPLKPSLNDSYTLQALQKVANQLLDLDQKSIKAVQVLQEKSSCLDKVQKKLKSVKSLLSDTEATVIKELKSYYYYFKEANEAIKTQKPKNGQVSIEKFKENLKIILKTFVHEDTIEQFSSSPKIPSQIYLLKSFYIDLVTEEPEIELNSGIETKKILNHMSFLVKSLEKLSANLLKQFRELYIDKIKQENPNFEEINSIAPVTPSQLKALKLKINRLHNRGSLTDEEAKNMLVKISIIPVSPDNESNKLEFKDQYETTYEDEFDFNNVTIDKAKNQLTHSFSRDLNKRIKQVKRISKRNSTPIKKIIRNTSLPKAIVNNKIYKEKVKQVKMKSKSPHSFL